MQENNYINLIKELTISDFKLRYQGSVLGYLWSLLKPLLLFSVLYIVFSIFLRFNIENYSLYLLLGIILWGYLAEGTAQAMQSLVNKGGLISRVAFPRSIIVIATTLTSFITLLLNLLVFVVFFVFSGITVHASILLFVVFLVELYFVVLGVGYLVAALNMKMRDVSHIWGVILQAGFWATPIIYSIEMIPSEYHFWFYLNPMTRIIQYSREVIIYGTVPDFQAIVGSFFIAVVIFIVGFLVFKKREPYFAEEI